MTHEDLKEESYDLFFLKRAHLVFVKHLPYLKRAHSAACCH